jgi:hypothetical protein
MQEHVGDVVAFFVMLCLPLIVWVVSRPPVWRRLRPRLERVAIALWRQLVQPDEPDQEALRRWAVLRLEQLRHHLERVRRLIVDDEWMTATRQTANRMAYEHLVRDVREAETTASAFGPVEPWLAPAAPSPLATSRFSFTAPAQRPAVEIIEFGPRGRWI